MWEEFQVCQAEEVDGVLRLVYYSIRFTHKGPSWKTLGRWFVSDRIVSKRILPKNMNK